MNRIGIRREDKSRFEGRVPLVPADLVRLIRDQGLEFTVQQSPVRAIPEDEFTAAGAKIAADLDDCPVVLGVKEIPVDRLQAGKTYVFFSHTIKGQAANLPALKRVMELGSTLIDYERITDDQGHRLVFFGRFAGLAGMQDSLAFLGRRLDHEGLPEHPFSGLKASHEYRDLDQIRAELQRVGESIKRHGLPAALRPLITGFAGYGQVSKGAQELYDCLPVREVAPEDVERLPPSAHECFKVVFKEEHLVRPKDASRPFELQEYYDHPELYEESFFHRVRPLTLLINCIYWDSRYPRLLSREQLAELYLEEAPRLRVIGDISCDIDGALACTTRCTEPDAPVYVYDPVTGETTDGVVGCGPVVLALDFLPCELPIDASVHFSRSLAPFVPGLGAANFAKRFEQCGLPSELARATIVYRGALTPDYQYLSRYLDGPGSA